MSRLIATSRLTPSLRASASARVYAPRPAVATVGARRFVSNKDDLGGPGGQDPPPKSSLRGYDLNSWAAIGGVAVLFGGVYWFMAFRPGEAEAAKQHVTQGREKLKDDVKSGADAAKQEIRETRLDEFSGRGAKSPGEKGLGAHRGD